MENITLVGFMGTGKTETAKVLADVMNKKYVSVDDEIEKKESRSINDIFRDSGEEYFRKIEKETIKKISSGNNQVIDAGGGAVLDRENMKNLSAGGTIVCLWASPEEIYERVKNHNHRPLLAVDNPLGKIEELLEKRRMFYERADIHIDTTGMSVEETVHKIKGLLNGEPDV